jgi:hypothetical protein
MFEIKSLADDGYLDFIVSSMVEVESGVAAG